jgi:hypothetical protein
MYPTNMPRPHNVRLEPHVAPADHRETTTTTWQRRVASSFCCCRGSPEHDLFVQHEKLKNTLRWIMGAELLAHLGTECLEQDSSSPDERAVGRGL